MSGQWSGSRTGRRSSGAAPTTGGRASDDSGEFSRTAVKAAAVRAARQNRAEQATRSASGGKGRRSRKRKDQLDSQALRRTLGILKPHVRKHAKLGILGIVALIADVLFRVIEPWPVKFAVDEVTRALGAEFANQDVPGDSALTTVIGCAVALAIIVAGRALTNYASTISFALVGARVATELRSRVFFHVQDLSLKYHSRASVGDTSQRLVGDINRLQEVAVTAGLPLIGNVLTLFVLVIVMFVLDPLLSIVILLTGAAYVVFSKVATPKITNASRSTRKGEGALVGSAAEALGAIRVVQSYGLESTVAREFAGGNERAMRAGVKAKRLAAGLERSTDVLVGMSSALVLGFGSWQVLRGAMTPGDLVLFFMYLKIAMKPLRDMAKFTGRIARASASGERIADLLDEKADIDDPPNPVPMTDVQGRVSFNYVSSRDGHGKLLFNHLDLVIEPGQHVGILGPSGAGKSTLASYVPRLNDPLSGEVLIDNYRLTDVARKDLRTHVAYVMQESILFATTVRENIRYGRLDATDADVEDAARRAGAHEFIMEFPLGYDTPLGQRGDNLSGGQRQRIAIARAMVRDAPVVILDEATTGLDPRSKAVVNESLTALAQGRTTISITHDVAAIQGMDRIVWLERGRIREDGTPEELLARPDSRFARWMKEQER